MTSYKHDTGKLRYHLVEPRMLEAIAEVLEYGATKYKPYSWRGVDEGVDRYTSALIRHLQAWRKGEVADEESGLPHMAHVATNALFLMELTGE